MAEHHLISSSYVGLGEILGNADNKLAIEVSAYLRYHVEVYSEELETLLGSLGHLCTPAFACWHTCQPHAAFTDHLSDEVCFA